MNRVQHGKSETRKERGTIKVQHEMSTTWISTTKVQHGKENKMKKVQRGKSVTQKECSSKKV